MPCRQSLIYLVLIVSSTPPFLPLSPSLLASLLPLCPSYPLPFSFSPWPPCSSPPLLPHSFHLSTVILPHSVHPSTCSTPFPSLSLFHLSLSLSHLTSFL